MGEYARYHDQQVKIGTCEDLYYIRYDQRNLVTPIAGNVNPAGEDRFSCRFRFPWPDEPNHAPGDDNDRHDFDRRVTIPGATHPEGLEHSNVQFFAHAGYLVSLPCPESSAPTSHGLTVHRNGFVGAVRLCQQKPLRDGRLVPVLMCGGCGARYRVEDPAEIEALIVACRAEADRRGDDHAAFWHGIADELTKGALLDAEPLAE